MPTIIRCGFKSGIYKSLNLFIINTIILIKIVVFLILFWYTLLKVN